MVGLYTSYATPIFLRVTSGREKLVPGPFTLGRWYLPVGSVAVAWVAFIVVLLCFPSSQTTNAVEMSESNRYCKHDGRHLISVDVIRSSDYASVIVLAVFIFAAASWLLSARKWFVGPLPNIDTIDDKIA